MHPWETPCAVGPLQKGAAGARGQAQHHSTCHTMQRHTTTASHHAAFPCMLTDLFLAPRGTQGKL